MQARLKHLYYAFMTRDDFEYLPTYRVNIKDSDFDEFFEAISDYGVMDNYCYSSVTEFTTPGLTYLIKLRPEDCTAMTLGTKFKFEKYD